MGSARDSLELLKSHANRSQKKGRFLLSTADVSDFWIDINEFLTSRVIESMTVCLAELSLVYYRTQGPFSLVAPTYTEASEKTFPLKLIVESACEAVGGGNEVEPLCAVFDHGSGKYMMDIKPERKCVPIVGVSVHITVLLGLIAALRDSGVDVTHAFTFLNREKTSLRRLANEGVTLVPILVANESTGDVLSLADAALTDDIDWRYLSEFTRMMGGSANG